MTIEFDLDVLEKTYQAVSCGVDFPNRLRVPASYIRVNVDGSLTWLGPAKHQQEQPPAANQTAAPAGGEI